MNHGWEIRPLQDICNKASSNLMQKNIDSENGKYPVFGASGIAGYIDYYVQAKDYIGIIKDGSGVGRVSVYPKESSLLGTLQYIIPNENMDLRYVAYALKSMNLAKYVSGAAIPHIYFRDYGEEKIAVPSIKTQSKVADELDKLNELIEIKRSQLKDLDALAQSLFYETFGDPIENPKGWKLSTIGDVASVQTGATPSRDIEEYFNGDIPWVKTTEVQNCDIFETDEHISPDALNNSNCKLFPINTIIVAMYGQGKTRGQIARLRIEACTNQACAAILPCSEIHPLFLYAFLRSSYEALRDIAVGCNQKNLNLSLVKNYTIFLPPLSLQEQFAARIEAIVEQKKRVEASIADLETILASRMDYWFND